MQSVRPAAKASPRLSYDARSLQRSEIVKPSTAVFRDGPKKPHKLPLRAVSEAFRLGPPGHQPEADKCPRPIKQCGSCCRATAHAHTRTHAPSTPPCTQRRFPTAVQAHRHNHVNTHTQTHRHTHTHTQTDIHKHTNTTQTHTTLCEHL